MAERSQVFDFHTWRKAQGHKADSGSDLALGRYKQSWGNTEEYVEYLGASFPTLQALSDKFVELTASFAEEVLSHWSEDLRALIDSGLIPAHSEVVGWDFLFDETHHGGKGAVAVDWRSGADTGRLIYKPRPADGEALLSAVFNFVAEEGERFNARTLTRGQHSWHEFIPHSRISDPELYLRRCGKVVAVCSLLGTTDLHADNVRPGPNNCPVIVDGETAVQLRPSLGGEIGTWELFSSGLVPTTLGSPLLIAYGGLSGGQGLGPSLEQSYMSFAVTDPDSDAVSVQRITKILKVASLGEEEDRVSAETKRSLIGEGLADAICRLKNTPDLCRSITELVRGKSFRQVVRGTNVYFALLTAASDPMHLAGKSPSPYRLLKANSRRANSIASIADVVADREISQLEEGDVPYFGLFIDSEDCCHIRDDSGFSIKVDSLPYYDGLNLAGRIKWLLNLSTEQIRSALNINDCTLDSEAKSPKIGDLRQYLLDTQASDVPQWLWVDSSSQERLRLVTGGASLVGSLGTAYAVGKTQDALAVTAHWPDSARLRWHAWGPSTSACVISGFSDERHQRWVEDVPGLLQEGSSGDYLTGLLGFLAHIPQAWRSPEIFELLSGAAVEEGDGLAHGKAGLLAAAVAVGDELAPRLAAELVERLTVAENFEQLAWCRGATGIIAALAAGGFLSRSHADRYVESVANITGELLSQPDPVDLSFCHGLAGVIGVLELLCACGHATAGTQAMIVREAVERRIRAGGGYFLAHPDVKEDPGFLNGYGSILALQRPGVLHPLLPPIQKGAHHALG
ncbi:DUF4135 domain-containing protein [Corynebacterium phocae]|nr:DUF4135 domain-containing protein [Corynebacterium phocae]